MRKVILCLCLATLSGLAPLHGQCKVAASGISMVSGGYAVSLPPQFLSAVPTREPLRLVLRDASGQVSSVSGPAQLLATGQLRIQTIERFSFSHQRCPLEAILQQASLGDHSCGSAEFGIGCFLSWCAGQTYCLPGDGPGGFVCACV